jgi:crossover junction endodeoxyribonuclease RuvC
LDQAAVTPASCCANSRRDKYEELISNGHRVQWPSLLLQYPCANQTKKCGTAALFDLDCVSMSATNGRSNALNAMRVLGIDPAASGPTGYGIVDSNGRNCRVLHYGALRVQAARQKESSGAALQDIHELVCGLIREFAPTVMAVESVFTALNMHTALRLSEVRGVVLLAAAQHELPVHSYSPREVKASVAGYGHADKKQMQLMVRALLSMSETPEPADAADALAVALCHLQTEQARLRYGLPGAKSLAKSRALPLGTTPGRGATRLPAPRIESTR